MSRRRFVARGVPGGYRIWDNRGRRWWGDLHELRRRRSGQDEGASLSSNNLTHQDPGNNPGRKK
ncbi:hypothetical protein AB0M11_02530 [Streptomyces sp. NPDC051987]|uniref:hypothetical protein n=1 Tax=Streptomyces sp. NPDC051987 TaxID=3155808 RepID=UPI0034258DFF